MFLKTPEKVSRFCVRRSQLHYEQIQNAWLYKKTKEKERDKENKKQKEHHRHSLKNKNNYTRLNMVKQSR